MAEGQRKFTKEFKVEAVPLVKEGGCTLSQVERDLGVNVGVLGKWCRQLEEHSTDAFPGKGRLIPQEEELRRLKRENEDLKEDRAIQKKRWPFSQGYRNEVSVPAGPRGDSPRREDVPNA
jgi:transposase